MSIDSRLDRAIAGKPQALADAIAATHLLIHSAVLLEQGMADVLAPLNLQLREYLALYMLADSVHESVTPSNLSESLKATRTQVTRLLDSMEAKGLVVRLAAMQDRRSLALSLTPTGAALLEQAAPLVAQVHLNAWAPLTETGTHALHSQLRQLYDGLQRSHATLYKKYRLAPVSRATNSQK